MFKVLLIAMISGAAPVQTAHVHGEAKVSIAFDGLKGKIEVHAPGESIFGFEHEARSKKDIRAKDKSMAKLEENISEMVKFSADSGCEIKKDIFEVNQMKGHSELTAEFSVACSASPAGSSIVFNFKKSFPGMKKVKVDFLMGELQKSLQVLADGDSLELK